MSQMDSERPVTEHFRCPHHALSATVVSPLSSASGFFRINAETIGFGQCASGMPARSVADHLHLASEHVRIDGVVKLPWNPVQIVDNLRLERYVGSCSEDKPRLETNSLFRSIYYLFRPLMPVMTRKYLQRLYFRGWEKVAFPNWPVDCTVENLLEYLLVLAMKAQGVSEIPFIWFWPDGASNCAIMTHDVETSAGVEFCPWLMDLNDSFGIKSSFQIVPEQRYPVRAAFLETIRRRGFEVNVHDLDHDGHLFSKRAEFLRRVVKINNYGRQWGAVGFRSAVLYRNPGWFSEFDFDYDMSIPNVAQLDPQRGGCCTVFPYLIGDLVELPVTATQDYSLFHVLGEYSTRLWQEQIAIIRARHGLMSFIIHPDYIISEKPRRVYAELLRHLAELRSQGETWIALPREVAAWWRMRSEMNLVKENGAWRIEGKGSARARIAYAVRSGDAISYRFKENA